MYMPMLHPRMPMDSSVKSIHAYCHRLNAGLLRLSKKNVVAVVAVGLIPGVDEWVSVMVKDGQPNRTKAVECSKTQQAGRLRPEGAGGKGVKKSENKTRPLSREITGESYRLRAEKEKYERSYKNWERVKNDTKQEKTQYLKSIISLQQELIKSKDEEQEEQSRQKDAQERKERKVAKATKQAQADTLLQICRKSLEYDKTKKKGQRRKKPNDGKKSGEKRREKKEEGCVPEKRDEREDAILLQQEESSFGEFGRDITMDGPHRQSTMATDFSVNSSIASGHLRTVPQSPPGAAFEEDDEKSVAVDDDQELAEEEEDLLPWHHHQLYHLYGKDADYFLYPKIEQEKTVVKFMNPKLRKQGGRAGAATLWRTLRNESKQKILEQDKGISPELKFAYNAFVRQCIAGRKKLVNRNYNASEDVPEMARLMDQSRVYNAQDFRHKVELMFRSSEINEDRSRVLMFNNPIPNVNNLDGADGVSRYIPSWIDQEQNESEKQWLKFTGNQNDDLGSDQSETARPSRNMVGEHSDHCYPGAELNVFSTSRKTPQPTRQQRYLFMTENDSSCKGQFSRRRKDLLEARNLPPGYRKNDTSKAQSARSLIGPGGDSNADSMHVSRDKTSHSHSQASSGYLNRWEPLSLSALQEYKENRPTIGQGDFAQGVPATWRIQT